MINDFLDNLAAHQYQKMHKKRKEIKETVDDMSMIDDQYSHYFRKNDKESDLNKYLAQPIDNFWKHLNGEVDDQTK